MRPNGHRLVPRLRLNSSRRLSLACAWPVCQRSEGVASRACLGGQANLPAYTTPPGVAATTNQRELNSVCIIEIEPTGPFLREKFAPLARGLELRAQDLLDR